MLKSERFSSYGPQQILRMCGGKTRKSESPYETFYSVSHRFRHNLGLHAFCLHAACNITQLLLETVEPLLIVRNDVNETRISS